MKNESLIRFWFEFEGDSFEEYPPGIFIGCGVTAFSKEDALDIINKKVLKGSGVSRVKKIVENVDISTLDKGHVVPNMHPPVDRGIWFPLGYE